ncbi:hypothetical protein BLS_004814 [Venturia inaequalis]|uniref:Uncharacterized protein n=1 Tax=Venturia inaequalis TaxID=5025 RepID=A0A8H3Z2C1_VENIN|nr:hypothetical protein BLS_004814 [Venturia inaequalis]
MSNESNALVLDTEERGARLSFALYEFSANVSSAMGDVDRLAKGINLLALGLRQAGDGVNKYGTLSSTEAWNTVRHVSMLCQEAYEEIERMVPIRRLQDAQKMGGLGGDIALATRLRSELDWNVLAKSKARFLLEYIEALRLTLSVISQTLYTANAIALSRRDRNQIHDSLVCTQRLQMETLIIEQQRSLLRMCRSFDQFRHKVDNAPLAVTHNNSPQSMELIRREDGPNPRALESYQEPSLLQVHQPQSDIDDLARVRIVSRSFVDDLLHRWTSLPGIIDGVRKIEQHGESRDDDAKRIDMAPTRDQANMGRLLRRNSNYQPAVAESEIDSEDENATRRPKFRLNTAGPVLHQVDDLLPAAGISAAIVATGEQLLSPQHAQSWSAGAGTYFPSSHGSSRPRQSSSFSSSSASCSTINSPRASSSSINSPRHSFSSMSSSPPSSTSDIFPPRAANGFQSDMPSFPPPPTHAVQPAPQSQQRPPIPWRIRVNQEYWDYRDALQIASNTRMDLRTATKDFKAVTEIMSDHVTRAAVKERGFEFTRIRIPIDVSRSEGRTRTEMASCLCIDGALGFNDIKALVERTAEMRADDELDDSRRRENEKRRGERGQPPSSLKRSVSSQQAGTVRPPPPERSQTAPMLRESSASLPSAANSLILPLALVTPGPTTATQPENDEALLPAGKEKEMTTTPAKAPIQHANQPVITLPHTPHQETNPHQEINPPPTTTTTPQTDDKAEETQEGEW